VRVAHGEHVSERGDGTDAGHAAQAGGFRIAVAAELLDLAVQGADLLAERGDDAVEGGRGAAGGELRSRSFEGSMPRQAWACSAMASLVVRTRLRPTTSPASLSAQKWLKRSPRSMPTAAAVVSMLLTFFMLVSFATSIAFRPQSNLCGRRPALSSHLWGEPGRRCAGVCGFNLAGCEVGRGQGIWAESRERSLAALRAE